MAFSPRDEQSLQDALAAHGTTMTPGVRAATTTIAAFPVPSPKVATAVPASSTSTWTVPPQDQQHRRLAVSLNNAGTLCHAAGDYPRALRFYQECVQARMEALSSSTNGRNTTPTVASSGEMARVRTLAVQAEERSLRRAAAQQGQQAGVEPACLDLYLRGGTRHHDKLEAFFLPLADPIEIALGETTMTVVDALLPPPPPQDSSAAAGTSAASANDDDARESSLTLFNMGLSHLRSKSFVKASQLFDMSLSVTVSSYRASYDPVHAARTLTASAQAFVGRGMLREASDELSEALRLWREAAAGLAASSRRQQRQGVAPAAPPARDLELGTADTLSLLGRVLLAAGDPARSLEVARQALRLRRSALGDDHVVVAATLYSIGLALREKSAADGSSSSQTTADAVEHVRWFVQHPLVNSDPAYRPHLAEALHTLGLLCLDGGETARAVEVFTRCVEVRTEAHGAVHPALADDLLQLGRVLHDAGRFREAAERYGSALAVETALARENPPPPVHHEEPQEHEDQDESDQQLREGESEGVATALCSLGQVYEAAGDAPQALRCYSTVLRIARALFGPTDEFVASMLSVIGNVHLEMGETARAVENFAEAERIATRLQEAEEAAVGMMMETGTGQDVRANDGSVVIGVPNLLRAIGIDFHPHAAAA